MGDRKVTFPTMEFRIFINSIRLRWNKYFYHGRGPTLDPQDVEDMDYFFSLDFLAGFFGYREVGLRTTSLMTASALSRPRVTQYSHCIICAISRNL
jgi:hypothetical protein